MEVGKGMVVALHQGICQLRSDCNWVEKEFEIIRSLGRAKFPSSIESAAETI
jgi:hypothetical protein